MNNERTARSGRGVRAGVQDRWHFKTERVREDDGTPLLYEDGDGSVVHRRDAFDGDTLKAALVPLQCDCRDQPNRRPTRDHGRGLRYLAVHVPVDGGQPVKKSFSTRRDADAFLRGNVAAVETGTYVDPTKARVTVKDLHERWAKTITNKTAGTQASYGSVHHRLVAPRWANIMVGDIDAADVLEWIAELSASGGQSGKGLAAQTVQHAHRVLSLILDHGVRRGNLRINPARVLARGDLPRARPAQQRHLEVEEVRRIAAAADYLRSLRIERQLTGRRLGKVTVDLDAAGVPIIPNSPPTQDGTLIRLLCFTGLRWGEAAGLKVRRVNLVTRALHICESVGEVSVATGDIDPATGEPVKVNALTWGHTKSHADRHLTFPAFLLSEMTALCEGKGPGDLVFASSEGTPLRNPNFRRRVFDPAVELAGVPPLRIHDTRHTYASLAVASGADVKVLQKALGHADASMTLNTYAALLDDKAASVADALDKLFTN